MSCDAARLTIAGLLALCLALPHSASAQEFRSKINFIDASHAPELTLYVSFLNQRNRPIPVTKVQDIEVFMNGKKVADNRPAIGLKDSPHPLAMAMVMCGYVGCTGKVAKIQAKSMAKLAALARGSDVGTVFVYENNVRNLNDNKFPSLAEAAGVTANARVSRTAYHSKFIPALENAVALFQSRSKQLPAERVIVIFSDGLDGTSKTAAGTEAKIKRLIRSAKAAGVRIYSIAFSASTDVGFTNLKLISRKTGGTFRRANKLKEMPIIFKEVAAEIFGQYVIDIVPEIKKRRDYRFSVGFEHRSKRFSTSREVPYLINVKELHFRWRYWGRIALIIIIILALIALIVLIVIIVKRRRKRKKEMEKSLEDIEEDEAEEEAEAAAEAEAEAEAEADDASAVNVAAKKKKKQARTKKTDQAKADKAAAAAAPGQQICPTCLRAMLPDWTECLFCQAGIPKGGES